VNDREVLEQLISRGEGSGLEFKAAIPSPHHLAREIAAFANSGGGTILLGVREDGTMPGVLASDAQKVLSSAIELLTPRPEALFTELRPSGTQGVGHVVGRVDVAPEPAGPVTTPDGVFRRTDACIEPLPAHSIRERALVTAAASLKDVVAPLATTLESLTQRMLDLEQQISAAQSWRRRLPDILLGAGISAVLGLILALLFL
jgi:predicted HTH transcriptional regulator